MSGGRLEPFLATYSGGKFYPFGPDPSRVQIEDIAHALSNICRYNGHTSEFWSVAAHSLALVQELRARGYGITMQYHGLLHDASEAYLMDVPRPIKPLFLNYEQWEENVERAVAIRFGLRCPLPVEVKNLDHNIVPREVASFFPPDSAAWARYGISRGHKYEPLVSVPPKQAEAEFLAVYTALKSSPELLLERE
jgi:hypothetical protein